MGGPADRKRKPSARLSGIQSSSTPAKRAASESTEGAESVKKSKAKDGTSSVKSTPQKASPTKKTSAGRDADLPLLDLTPQPPRAREEYISSTAIALFREVKVLQ